MTILVGIDFSEHSERALRAAARLAARMGQPLRLVHALEWSVEQDWEASKAHFSELQMRMQQRAAHARTLGAQAEAEVTSGSPDVVLLDAARRHHAQLVVVAAVGARREHAVLGGHADRLAQASHVPVLVVRDAAAFEEFAAGRRPLRIVLGADDSMCSRRAMQWVEALRKHGPCEVIAIHLFWPPSQFQRLGLGGVHNYLEPGSLVSEQLARELCEHLSCSTESSSLKVRVEPHLGRVADRLASLAAEERADLIVVGSHARTTAGRFLEGSVSHALLRSTQISVVCVPAPETVEHTGSVPHFRNIVVATDFSLEGNAAVALAYGLAPQGATVHLVHVVPNAPRSSITPHDIFLDSISIRTDGPREAARQQLVALIPNGALAAHKSSRVHLLESAEPAMAIAQAAERLDADVVCVGTHGRSGIARAVLGSVAQAVVSHTKRPVLLAQAPLE